MAKVLRSRWVSGVTVPSSRAAVPRGAGLGIRRQEQGGNRSDKAGHEASHDGPQLLVSKAERTRLLPSRSSAYPVDHRVRQVVLLPPWLGFFLLLLYLLSRFLFLTFDWRNISAVDPA
jgi:hypothetical protein